jgi:hypothetical protein
MRGGSGPAGREERSLKAPVARMPAKAIRGNNRLKKVAHVRVPPRRPLPTGPSTGPRPAAIPS